MKGKEKLAWIAGLTFLAGGINIAAILLAGQAISHHTGALSDSSIALGEGNWSVFANLSLTIFLFFLGSVLAGYIYHDRKPEQMKFHYILPMGFGLLLILNGLFFRVAYLPLFAFGMGIQNGSLIEFEGIYVRTTHMTGYISDAAGCLGRMLHGHNSEVKKMQFYFISIFCYFSGGVLTSLLIFNLGNLSLIILGIAYLTLGITLALAMSKRPVSIRENAGLQEVS